MAEIGLRSAFVYQECHEQLYCASRIAEAKAISDMLDESPVAFVDGRSGYGKTTLLKSALKQSCEDRSWRYLYVKVPAKANIEAVQAALDIATDDPTLAQVHASEQRVGNIDSSSSNIIMQVMHAPGAIGRLINTLITCSYDVIALDQYEELYHTVPDEAARLVSLLQVAGDKEGHKKRFVIAVASSCVNHYYSSARDGGAFFTIRGLTPESAGPFLDAAMENLGLTEPTIKEGIISVLNDPTKGIWPVGLSACCTAMGQVRDQYDWSSLNPEVFVALAISEALPHDVGYEQEDYILALSYVARAQVASLEELSDVFATRDDAWVSGLIVGLVAVRLLENSANGLYSLTHESIESGLALLRGSYPWIEDYLFLADTAVAGRGWEEMDCVAIEELLDLRRLPASISFRLACIALRDDELSKDDETVAKTRKALRQHAPTEIARQFDNSLGAQKRDSHFVETLLSVLFLDGRSPTVERAFAFLCGERAQLSLTFEGWRVIRGMAYAPAGAITTALNTTQKDVLRPEAVSLCLRYLSTFGKGDSLDSRVIEWCWNRYPEMRAELLSLQGLSDRVARRLIREGCQDRNPLVRSAAIVAAAPLPFGRDIVFDAALAHDGDADVRRTAIYSMRRYLDDQRFVTTVRTAWESEESPLVREAIIELINESRADMFQELLYQAIEDDADFVRESAVYALAGIYKKHEWVKHRLDNLYNDRSPKVKDAMVQCFGLPDGMALVEYAHSMHELPADLQAKVVMKCPRTEQGESILFDVLSGSGYGELVIVRALERAAEIQSEKCANAAIGFLCHMNVEIVCAAIVVIQNGMRDFEKKARLLCPLASHSSFAVRERIVYALGELEGSTVEDSLMGLLFDAREPIRIKTVYALGRRGCNRAKPIVDRMFGSTAFENARTEFYRLLEERASTRSLEDTTTPPSPDGATTPLAIPDAYGNDALAAFRVFLYPSAVTFLQGNERLCDG